MILKIAAFLLAMAVAVAGLGYIASQPRLAASAIPGLVETGADVLDRMEGTSAGAPQAFTVKPGDSGAVIASGLVSQGLISNARLFRYLLAFYGAETQVKAGEYRIDGSSGTRSVVRQLIGGGSDRLVSVTIPEGLRAEEIGTLLENAGVASRTEFLQLVFSGDVKVPNFPLPAGPLEGALYPDTYNVPPNFGARAMLQMMLETFKDRSGPVLAKGTAQGLSPQQVLVLASVVEREAALPQERPVLAGVFLNRLAIGMPLGADPTVQYALVAPNTPAPPADGYWKQELTFEDLRSPSPYNTYVVTGLPPAPIANPGLGSIRGVVEPTASKYLYFVARPDHSHALAETFQEHQANVARYQN